MAEKPVDLAAYREARADRPARQSSRATSPDKTGEVYFGLLGFGLTQDDVDTLYANRQEGDFDRVQWVHEQASSMQMIESFGQLLSIPPEHRETVEQPNPLRVPLQDCGISVMEAALGTPKDREKVEQALQHMRVDTLSWIDS